MHLVAGAVGAFGNQVLYWGNRVRIRNHDINRRMIPISVAYVCTGAGVGCFVGIETVQILWALSAGAFWPETLKALDGARNVSAKVAERMKIGRDAAVTPPDDGGAT